MRILQSCTCRARVFRFINHTHGLSPSTGITVAETGRQRLVCMFGSPRAPQKEDTVQAFTSPGSTQRVMKGSAPVCFFLFTLHPACPTHTSSPKDTQRRKHRVPREKPYRLEIREREIQQIATVLAGKARRGCTCLSVGCEDKTHLEKKLWGQGRKGSGIQAILETKSRYLEILPWTVAIQGFHGCWVLFCF